MKLLLFTFFIITRRCAYLLLGFFDTHFSQHRKLVFVLSYHSVRQDAWRFSVDPDVIKKQIDYLNSRYTIITLNDLALFIQGKKSILLPAVVLTFDDGYKDILAIKKYLIERHITPALFILSDTIHANWNELGSKRPFLNKHELHSLAKLGWEIGAHSATHANLLMVKGKALKKEIIESKKVLEKTLQIPIKYFAYPRGKYSLPVVRVVKKAQYDLALTMDDGFITQRTNTFLVPRIGIDRTHTFSEFKATVSPSVITVRSIIKRSFLGKYL